MKDFEIRELLVELDESFHRVTPWEADFINDVAFGDFPLTLKQENTAINILEKYELI